MRGKRTRSAVRFPESKPVMNTPFHDDRGSVINYYEILNVPYDAEKSVIRSSFCSLIKYFHPDIAGENTDQARRKVDLLIRGYKILSDDSLRTEYNRHLFSHRRVSPEGYIIVPKKRIRYSTSLSALLKERILNKKIRHRERVYKLGQDVEIFVMPSEAAAGIIAYIDLPARIACPLCYGEDRDCHVCHGVGRIHSSSTLEVTIPPPVKNNTVNDFDLIKARPDRFTSFTMKTLRVRITVIGKKPAHH